MSLPPGFLDELRTRVSIADVIGRKVLWDPRKSQQGKGEYWAPCPFHQEKTPSFKVDDRQGRYYCFGCQAKGDAITFLRETENMGFMEAVESLASEAGMEMPARDPRAREKADRASQLAEVMETAQRWFRLQLQTGAAAQARAYLDKRGLDKATQDRFEIGFAPDSYSALLEALAGKSIDPELIAAAGLSKAKDGGRPYATFRGRIMFPIRDTRGRVVAFGGRALSADTPAKYLNSPETELFHKSRVLYNHAPARTAAGKGAPLIVAEGYMDVIALAQAGFDGGVAALGTAVTEHHLAMLWKIADEPVFAMDGDRAGKAAAHKVVRLAMPLLAAGKSVRFALMPDGKDPDDILRAPGGRAAMEGLLANALPLIDLLWEGLTEGRDLSSPERRAALDKDLREALRAIEDKSVRGHYAEEIKRRREALFGFTPRSQGAGRGFYRGRPQQAPVRAATKNTALANNLDAAERLLEATFLAVLARHPGLIDGHIEALETLSWSDAFHADLATELTELPEGLSPEATQEHLSGRLSPEALEVFFAQGHIRINPAMKPGATDADALPCLVDVMTKLDARRGHARELSEAKEDLEMETAPEALAWRVSEATASRAAAYKVAQDDGTQSRENSKEMSDYLQSLLDNKVWEKKKR